MVLLIFVSSTMASCLYDAIGRLALWRIPFQHIALTAAVEYAIGYIDGAH